MSWARLGANVTGVDLSPVAIEKARQLAEQAKVDAEFICSDVYAFGTAAEQQFDIIFTSYGALCWLPDLQQWANTVDRCLRPGGRFYMVEFHPVYDLFVDYPYFHNEKPDIDEDGTYTENCDGTATTTATWAHPLSEVINALLHQC
jgi:SAM-dependent methyltransferase